MSKRIERRERETLAARKAIIDAAIAVFAEHGYHGCTVEQLAGAAGYSVGSLYNYFSGKQQLYRFALQKITRELQEAMQVELPESVGFFEAIVWSVQRHFTVMKPYRRFFRTAFEERASFELGLGTEIVAIQDALGQVAFDRTVTLVERAQQRGDLRPGASKTIAWLIIGAMSSLFHIWVLGEVDEDVDSLAREFVDLLAEGLRAPEGSP